MERFWKANPHEWGPGRIHVIHQDGKRTRCGRQLVEVPGQYIFSVEYDCGACSVAVQTEERRKRKEAEWQEWMRREQQQAPGPIETHYRGCRFRSRLEARWAVFLDKMGTSWEYEKEGYRLPDGTQYLPDFWLPALHLWLEVKGQTPTKEELRKCELLRDQANAAVAIFHGQPVDFYCGTLFCWDEGDSSAGASKWEVSLAHDYENKLCLSVDTNRVLWADSGFNHQLWLDNGCGALEWAAEAARGARFEFGEEG